MRFWKTIFEKFRIFLKKKLESCDFLLLCGHFSRHELWGKVVFTSKYPLNCYFEGQKALQISQSTQYGNLQMLWDPEKLYWKSFEYFWRKFKKIGIFTTLWPLFPKIIVGESHFYFKIPQKWPFWSKIAQFSQSEHHLIHRNMKCGQGNPTQNIPLQDNVSFL